MLKKIHSIRNSVFMLIMVLVGSEACSIIILILFIEEIHCMLFLTAATRSLITKLACKFQHN